MPGKELFRTERYDRIDNQEQRDAHMAARYDAGEPAEHQTYSIAEHKALLALLGSIDPVLTPPEPLDYGFDASWMTPRVTIRYWEAEPGQG